VCLLTTCQVGRQLVGNVEGQGVIEHVGDVERYVANRTVGLAVRNVSVRKPHCHVRISILVLGHMQTRTERT
jgi:hypothetical protein